MSLTLKLSLVPNSASTSAQVFAPSTNVILTTSGCSTDEEVEQTIKEQVVFVERGGCEFYEKVANLERLGARGVVIFNNNQDQLLTMMSEPNSPSLNIPAVFITRQSMQEIKSKMVEIEEVVLFKGDEYMMDFLSFPIFIATLYCMFFLFFGLLVSLKRRFLGNNSTQRDLYFYSNSNSIVLDPFQETPLKEDEVWEEPLITLSIHGSNQQQQVASNDLERPLMDQQTL